MRFSRSRRRKEDSEQKIISSCIARRLANTVRIFGKVNCFEIFCGVYFIVPCTSYKNVAVFLLASKTAHIQGVFSFRFRIRSGSRYFGSLHRSSYG